MKSKQLRDHQKAYELEMKMTENPPEPPVEAPFTFRSNRSVAHMDCRQVDAGGTTVKFFPVNVRGEKMLMAVWSNKNMPWKDEHGNWFQNEADPSESNVSYFTKSEVADMLKSFE
jgi:hypothetical protein